MFSMNLIPRARYLHKLCAYSPSLRELNNIHTRPPRAFIPQRGRVLHVPHTPKPRIAGIGVQPLLYDVERFMGMVLFIVMIDYCANMLWIEWGLGEVVNWIGTTFSDPIPGVNKRSLCASANGLGICTVRIDISSSSHDHYHNDSLLLHFDLLLVLIARPNKGSRTVL